MGGADIGTGVGGRSSLVEGTNVPDEWPVWQKMLINIM